MSDSELAVVAPQTFPTPILIERAGPSTRKKFFEFFTVPIVMVPGKANRKRIRPRGAPSWAAVRFNGNRQELRFCVQTSFRLTLFRFQITPDAPDLTLPARGDFSRNLRRFF